MSEKEADVLDAMVRPELSEKIAAEIAERLWGVRGGSLKELVGYDDRNFWLKPSEVSGNPHLEAPCRDGYVLKVMNSLDSKNVPVVGEQNKLLTYLSEHGVRCPRPARTKDGRTFSLEELTPAGPRHAIRMLEFVPGDILGHVQWHRELGILAGREVARIDNILDGLSLPSLESRTTEWSLWQAPRVLKYIDLVIDSDQKNLVKEVLAAFSRAMEERADDLRDDWGLIHGDLNQFNVVVSRAPSGRWEIAGVLDFGDSHGAPRLFEVALAAAYMALHSGDVDTIGDVLAGYSSVRRGATRGTDLLRVCVCARLCQSLVMGLRAHHQDPTNTYVLDSQAKGWPLLHDLWRAEDGELEHRWKTAGELLENRWSSLQ